MSVWFLVVFGCVLMSRTRADVFTAVATMADFILAEDELIDALELCFDFHVRDADDNVSRMLQELKRHMVNAKNRQEAVTYASHPLNAYQLIKRWSQLNHAMLNIAKYEACKEVSTRVGVALPSLDEYQEGATMAVLRLQRTYSLDTAEVAVGRILGVQAADSFSQHDCYLFGTAALKKADFGLAAQWLTLVLRDGPVEDGSLPWVDAITRLVEAHQQIGDFPKAVDVVEEATDKSNDDAIEQLLWETRRQYNAWLGENKDVAFNATTWTRPVLADNVTRNYEALCRGDIGNDHYINPTARCRYKAGSIAYVRYKEEILRDDPEIVMFYDVISDAESSAVREMARGQLKRATVGNPKDGYQSNIRISKITWLDDNVSSLLLKLSKRIEDITGLDTTLRTRFSSTELFQVLNYGIGGQYDPHFDFYEDTKQLKMYPPELLGSGERLATFLFYLTDVKFGGATVFPNVGVRVKVVKNGAAFWYNLKSSGDHDRDTLHAGCPVLLGSKWVTNKWIHEYGQQFRRPCGLTRNSPPRMP